MPAPNLDRSKRKMRLAARGRLGLPGRPPRRPQAEDRSLAGASQECAFPLHADECLLAEPSRNLVLDPRRKVCDYGRSAPGHWGASGSPATTTLFAALEVATGQITVAHKKRRRRSCVAPPSLRSENCASTSMHSSIATTKTPPPSPGPRPKSTSAASKTAVSANCDSGH